MIVQLSILIFTVRKFAKMLIFLCYILILTLTLSLSIILFPFLILNPIPPGLFWSSWAWGGGGGGLQKPHLNKSKSIDAIDMKLGDLVEHYYPINYTRIHVIMTS